MTYKSDYLILVTIEDIIYKDTMEIFMRKDDLESFQEFLKEKGLKNLRITQIRYYDYLNDCFKYHYIPPDKTIGHDCIRLIDLIVMDSEKK